MTITRNEIFLLAFPAFLSVLPAPKWSHDAFVAQPTRNTIQHPSFPGGLAAEILSHVDRMTVCLEPKSVLRAEMRAEENRSLR
jgi:hypothetical protein